MLLGFKKQFAPKILDGSKKFTIRNRRKIEPKIGETLHMYTGLRTSHTEKITSAHKLTGIQLVDIKASFSGDNYLLHIKVDGRPLDKIECEDFAVADGFENAFKFVEYWADAMGEATEHFEQGKRKAIAITLDFSVTDLIIYHWTDLRF